MNFQSYREIAGGDALPDGSAKTRIKRILERVGLRRPLGAVHVRLRKWGLAPWRPLVPEQQFANCVDNAISALREADPSHEFGDYLEFGVSRGSSLAAVHHVLAKNDLPAVRLIGFDSFAGMPPEAAGEGWDPGAFASPIGFTRRHLKNKGVDMGKVTLVKGWFSDTLNEKTRIDLRLDKASLIMIDCDIYTASRQALAFSVKHIQDRAVVIFDDWGWREQEGEPGQKEAFEELLTQHRDIKADPLPSYLEQARVFLLTRVGNKLTLGLAILSSMLGLEIMPEAA